MILVSKLCVFGAKRVDIGTELLTTKAIVTDMTCHVAFSPPQAPGRSHIGLEEKGCLQSKGKEQARQRGGRRAPGACLQRKLLVWVVN